MSDHHVSVWIMMNRFHAICVAVPTSDMGKGSSRCYRGPFKPKSEVGHAQSVAWISTLLAASTPAWIAGCSGRSRALFAPGADLSVVSPSNVAGGHLERSGRRGPKFSVDFHPVDHTVAPMRPSSSPSSPLENQAAFAGP